MTNRPTPAEAMALYHSLQRPSSYKVAARFTAAGRPITARSISRWKKQGWKRVPRTVRTDMATAAEAQAMWEAVENPSCDKVAAALRAQGRQVCRTTIGDWRRAGWSATLANTRAKTSNAARTKAAAAAARAAARAPRGRARTPRPSNRPTPAEAMALYHSLERPNCREVAARFTAAGRPIAAGTVKAWRRQGWPGAPNPPRINRPTPADAGAIWDSLEQPTVNKVVDAFKAQGRPIGHTAIWSWKRTGWSRVTAKNAAAKIDRAIETIAAAVPALTGDPMTTLADILTEDNAVPGECLDDPCNNDRRHNEARHNGEQTGQAARRTLRTAAAIAAAIHRIADAVPEAGDPASTDARPAALQARAEGIGTLMTASSAGASVAIAVTRLLAARAEGAAEAPGRTPGSESTFHLRSSPRPAYAQGFGGLAPESAEASSEGGKRGSRAANAGACCPGFPRARE